MKTPLLLTTWLAGLGLALVLSLGAVTLVLAQVSDVTGAPLSLDRLPTSSPRATAVGVASTAASPSASPSSPPDGTAPPAASTEPTEPTTPSPRGTTAPSTASPTSTPNPATASPAAPSASSKVFDLTGGTTSIGCSGTSPALGFANPKNGYQATVETSGSIIEVRFRSSSFESKVQVSCASGSPVGEIRERQI